MIFLMLFTFSILYFIFGADTLYKNTKALRNRMFFSLCIHLSLWAFGYAFMSIAPDRESANFWRLVSAFGWCFIYSVWLDFSILVKYESKDWMKNIKRMFIYLPGICFFIGNLAYEPSKIMLKVNKIWMDIYPNNYFEALFTLYYVGFVLTGIIIIYKWGKYSHVKMEKKQSKIIVITSTITFVFAALIDTILPFMGFDIFPYGILAFTIALWGIWRAITKYKMMSFSTKDVNEYILRTIDDPIILIGTDLVVTEANNAALEFTGYGENEIKKLPIKAFIADSKYSKRAIEAILRVGGIKNIEVGLLAKNNNVIPCLLSGAPINNEFNEIIGIACIFHNITDRKNAEKVLIEAKEELERKVNERTNELQKINYLLETEISERKKAEYELKSSEEKYKALMKQSTDGIIVVDPDTLKVIESNTKVCEILEYTDDEINSLPIENLLSLDRDRIAKRVEEIVGHDHAVIKEISRVTVANGLIKGIEFSTALVRYNNKQFIMVTLVDITEKLNMENRKQQIVKMESLGTLAGGIAHDFNNILAGIIGYTQLSLEDSQEGLPIEDNLFEVLKLGDRAKKLISKILTFSRKTVLEPCVIDLQDIVIETLAMLKTTVPSYIEIKYAFGENPAFVLADPGEMQQLIMNLCVNAELAMNNKGGVLKVTLSELLLESTEDIRYQTIGKGKYIKMQVVDNGCGMDKLIMERIFEPFYTTRVAHGGTGLGLSVVHGIVRRHGGVITVDSELNKGSTFTVLLPASKNNSSDAEINTKVRKNISARILFVDDEESIVNTTVRLLQRLGYDVTGVPGGREALNLFELNKESYDLVITDQSMPDMSGEALIGELIKLKPDISIILCSGYSNVIDNDKLKSIKKLEFLLKPVSKLELINAIEKFMVIKN
jgi:PAS domain S-box-containing protein